MRPDTRTDSDPGIPMASDKSFVQFVVDQLDPDLDVSFRMMFGEYGLFNAGKLFGLVCDNRLLIKPTEGGRAWIGDVVEAQCYPGAKNSLLIEERMEDGPWLSELVRITTRELPEPKKKKPKK